MQQESPLSLNHSNTASPSTNELEGHNDGLATKITRRSHRKSRAGCQNCKTRRIKCDETKPECGNCKRRQVHCDFSKPANIPSSHTGPISSFSSGELPISEIELTYYYTTSTCFTVSPWSTSGISWQNQMAEIGFENPCVLHLMFAFTALHLAHCRPSRRELYVTTADHHYERALILVTPEIANLSSSNCDAVLAAVQMICFISWGRGPQPGEYLAFGKDKRSDWLMMFRGIRTTLSSVERHRFVKTHAPAAQSKNRPLPAQEVPVGYKEQLDELRQHVDLVTEDTPQHEEDVKAVDVLREMYDNRYQGVDTEYHVVFGWLYRMTDGFLERLQQRDPTTMIMYAHFVVLVCALEQFWYMKGWTHHVMYGIWELLPQEHRAWLDWPAKRVGWIKP
ncbi:sequence-specific DNA binding RNA polymerase II transcription factor [Ascochyta rabiei]|uniref:Sequence-specific DNA binding RNA polymerase II transcription factor n=2 Tax=Didymella rabiei TaxID=5454 RepID=A0A163L599_DIDRA|nr:sequence-specific DNA binding RNA polymerase II transcription factor [Ascochyta rabiei]